MADEFRRFYKVELLQENTLLKEKLLKLSPYSQRIEVQLSEAKVQIKYLNEKLERQDRRIMDEHSLFQNLEESLLDAQKRLLEKSQENIKDLAQSMRPDEQSKLLLKTSQILTEENQKLREQGWNLQTQLK